MPLNFNKRVPAEDDIVSDKSNIIRSEKKNTEYTPQRPKYSFDDIILSSEQRKQFYDIIAYDQYREMLMEVWGMKKLYPEGKGLLINIYGPSGTGKTMSAHAIADRLGKDILAVNYSEIESKFVGETAKNLVGLFDFANNNDVVLLFDEADALLSKRVTNMTTSNDVSVNQTKSVLLNILNDYTGAAVFTTNFISNYDYAFLRRIPFQIGFKMPDEEQRLSLWKHYFSTGVPYSCDLAAIARDYGDLSGSDISSAVWMSAIEAAQTPEKTVSDAILRKKVQDILSVKNKYKSGNGEARIVSEREVDEKYALEQINGGKKV